MPKSATIVPLSGNRDIDGILWGVKWTLPALTYSFPTQLDQFTGHPDGAIDGFRPLRAAQIKAVNDIADQLNSLIGIDLQFTPDAASANIRLSTASSLKLPGFADSGKIETAIGLSPDQTRVPTYAFGDIFFNRVDYAKPMVGTYAYQTIMHELGHALGLKHGHATQPSPGGDSVITKLPASHDTLEYSVMTYRSCLGWTVEYGYTNDTNSFPQSFMMNDIAALQYLYGADYTHNAGDTTYSWNSKTGEMSIDGKTRGRPADSKVFLTIWDGGGNDTYDLSSYGLGALDIDLGAGGFSVFSSLQLALLKVDSGIYARGNVYNALLHEGNIRSLIENAIGGDGRDSLNRPGIAGGLLG